MCIAVDCDGYEFLLVSLDNKQWNFEASTSEERDEWVQSIEQSILTTLQVIHDTKQHKKHQEILIFRSIPIPAKVDFFVLLTVIYSGIPKKGGIRKDYS